MTRGRWRHLLGQFHPALWHERRICSKQDQDDTEICVLTPLLEFLPPAHPPIGLLAKIEAKIDRFERDKNTTHVRAPHWSLARREVVAGLSGALVSAAAVLVIVLARPRSISDPDTPTRLAILKGSETSRVLIAEVIEGGRYLRLQHSGPPIDPDRALELWVIPGGDGVPQSLGLVANMGSVTVLPSKVKVVFGDVLALSEEPAGGSPTGSPTGPVRISGLVGGSG